MAFTLHAPFEPTGDQPQAIAALKRGLKHGLPFQTLLGVTGSGKTFTDANVIAEYGKPTLLLSHNKTLAAQLYEEFTRFFPNNAVRYFVSYFDYYQPEAYIPSSDTYIQKDSNTNEELDRLRHQATQAILTRNDVLVVASVSAIYGIGSPENYQEMARTYTQGDAVSLRQISEHLIDLQYERNDVDPVPGTFRIRGPEVTILPPTGDERIILRVSGNRIEELAKRGLGIDDPEESVHQAIVFPGRFWVSPEDEVKPALARIEQELEEQLAYLKKEKKLLEADRLGQRTRSDLAMLRETGMCHGIENYSRHIDGREPGTPPFTLIDYFNYVYGENEWLLVIDESHQTIPQIRGMERGDRSRKDTLVDHGFRLPSARDNRPLTFDEFLERVGPTIFQSATPQEYELDISEVIPKPDTKPRRGYVEQLIRPTGLLDPTIEIHPSKNQLQYLVERIEERIQKKQRVLVTTLTKRLAEELTVWLADRDIAVEYIHSDVKTLERPEILHRLRSGEVDVLVGINLLREGLDLPEVSLVAILDADQEGFLRNETTLIQVMGRAARHVEGHVILFADTETKSMKAAIEETNRRRERQQKHNEEHGITPKSTTRSLERSTLIGRHDPDEEFRGSANPEALRELRSEMRKAAKDLNFEKAARLRDLIKKLTKE